MKYCNKSTPEPTGLAGFRSAKPHASWEAFKNEARDACECLVVQLRKDQGGLCAYCELQLSENNLQVGHFHPKSDKSASCNWGLEWSNLWLCCKGGTQTWLSGNAEYLPPLPANRSCDEHKQDQVLDEVILRPDEVPIFPRIFSYRQQVDAVEIEVDSVRCEHSGTDPARAQNTIAHLNLNCDRLARARLTVLKIIEKEIADARKSGKKDVASTAIPAKWLSQNSAGHYRPFFTLIRWRLSAAGDQHLINSGYQG